MVGSYVLCLDCYAYLGVRSGAERNRVGVHGVGLLLAAAAAMSRNGDLWELLLMSSMCQATATRGGGLRLGDTGLLPLGRQRMSCWSVGVPGMVHFGYVMLRATWGPWCVATLLLYIPRLDLLRPQP